VLLAEQPDGTIDPGIKVGLDALFEFDQAEGKGIRSGCQWEVRTEIIVDKPSVSTLYFGFYQLHDLTPS
jgi:hypothetical protein